MECIYIYMKYIYYHSSEEMKSGSISNSELKEKVYENEISYGLVAG